MSETEATEAGPADGESPDAGEELPDEEASAGERKPTDKGAADKGPADTGPADTGPADPGPTNQRSPDGTGTTTREWSAIGLVVSGVLLFVLSTFGLEGVARSSVAVIAGLASLAGAGLFFRRLSDREIELGSRETEVATAAADLDERETQFAEEQLSIESRLKGQSDRIEQKNRDLANRLLKLQEWVGFVDELEENQAQSPADHEQHLALDRELLELLETESKRLFEAILANRYAPGGQLDSRMLREDLYDLAERVARVYRPGSERPLLETSPQQILRASSRVSLHLMVVIDSLPMGVSEANLNDLYAYVHSGVKAYGAYKAAEPYLGFLGHSFSLGRAVTAANPATIGAWWVAMQIGKQGGKALAKKYLESQAIQLIHELIRIVAYEVATLYSPGFRWRDAEWLYGVELVHLVQHFPASRDSFRGALIEIEQLRLRNEYDRVFLFRCLSGKESNRLDTFDPALLSMEAREQIARKLEEFLGRHSHGITEDKFKSWASDVSDRLQVQVVPPGEFQNRTRPDLAPMVVRSWLTFAMRMQNSTPDEAVKRVSALNAASGFPETLPEQVLDSGDALLPEVFEPIDLDPRDSEVERYVSGLLELAMGLLPMDPIQLEFVRRTALFYRCEPTDLRNWETRIACRWLKSVVPASVEVSDRETDLALALMQRPDAGGKLSGFYMKLKIDGVLKNNLPPEPMCLILTDSKLEVFSISMPERTVWTCHHPVKAQRVSKMISDDCRLTGGTWEWSDRWSDASLIVRGQFGSVFERHFATLTSHPLVDLVMDESSSSR